MNRVSEGFVFFSFALIALLPAVNAQDEGAMRGRYRHWLKKLSPNEAIRVRAAYDLAIRDQTVRAAEQKRDESEKAYHDALYTAMVRVDSSLEPILRKIPGKKHHRLW
jgi:hypothetical protein